MDKITLIYIGVYLISCFCSYRYIQIAYGKNGRFSTEATGIADFFDCFCPFINTFNSFAWLFNGPYESHNWNNFFRVKK